MKCFDQRIILLLFSHKVHGSLRNNRMKPWIGSNDILAAQGIKGTPAKYFGC